MTDQRSKETPKAAGRVTRFLVTPFGVATLGLLLLAGWATWSAGVFDGPVAAGVRASSVYVEPGLDLDLDQADAERAIGNRRLVTVFLGAGADPSQVCDDTENAAAGTLVVLLRPGDGEFDSYGCAHFPGDDEGENFGKAFVAEVSIAKGADQFLDRPLDAVKIMAVNYDRLVRSGTVPDGARTVRPAAPRYLLAATAVVAVVGGAATVFVVGGRVGRLAARRRHAQEDATDARASLGARAAALAARIIELDRRPGVNTSTAYRRLAADYADLAAGLTAERVDPALADRVDALTERAADLGRTTPRTRT